MWPFNRKGTEAKPKHASMFDYPDEYTAELRVPLNCPKCSGRIEMIKEGQETKRECEVERLRGRTEVVTRDWTAVVDTYLCRGLVSRAEVEEFLAPEFPGGKVSPEVTSRPSCLWVGMASAFGTDWV